jgi:hypothetical protein
MSSSNPTTPCLFTQTDEPTLRETYESVTSHLHATGSSDNTVVDQAPVDGVGSVVVLDGLSTLCEMGFEGKQVEMFVRGLMGWVSKVSLWCGESAFGRSLRSGWEEVMAMAIKG